MVLLHSQSSMVLHSQSSRVLHSQSRFRGFFGYLYGAEDFVHNLRNYRVAVGFEGFGAPLGRRKGKVVQRKGKPIISSVNRGDSREPLPASASCCTTIFAMSSSKLPLFLLPNFSLFRLRSVALFALGVESIIGIRSFSSIVHPCSRFRCIRSPSGLLGFFSSLAVGVGRSIGISKPRTLVA